ncbi:MAG: putative 3-demethylubiquinone-9 3-O-methyltransferase [Acidobacteriaceae bacterium]|nr:putative 3-demethylubiquinone-9 3-O-methyltransferase [Acidobacteriaceae bacterium]
MTVSANRTSEFFHSYAHDFNAIYGNSNTFVNRWINRYLRASMRLRYEKTIAGCNPIEGKSVLDIGCGPGHYSVALAKNGAARVYGIDFADEMIAIASQNAAASGVEGRCQFARHDFLADPIDGKYDYTVAMGFMDYMADPRKTIEKVLSVTKGKAFFSFPTDRGILAWQRKLRYKQRCPLYLYSQAQLDQLFSGVGRGQLRRERIARDYFVTVTM